MADKQALSVKAFGGINKLHTRSPGQPSTGKNFWTRNGVLITREGCSLLPSTPFTGTIRSVHSAARAQIVPRLLVEEGSKLWRYNTLDWTTLLTDVSGNGFSSVMYYDHLILVNGPQKYAYNVSSDSIAPLINLEDSDVPDMEFITVHKDILFGWAPNYAPTDTIYFNGYEKDAEGKILGRHKDYWPPDFAIKVPDGSGSPVLACISAGTHLLILTQQNYWLLYGDNEDNFSLVPGGVIGVYNERCVAKVGDYAIWLGEDNHGIKRVYAYTGTQPYVISQQAEELINDLPASAFANVRAYGFGTKFWLILPNTISNTMKAFVFDVEEKQWYIHEFPAAFMCACLHGFFDEKRIYFGANDARVIWLDESSTDDFGNLITTELKIGPLNIGDGRKYKVKRLWINAEPHNDFTIDVYTSSDAGDESGPYSVTFEAGGQKTEFVKPRAGHKGKDIYLRVVTQGKINELQSFSLTIVPKNLK